MCSRGMKCKPLVVGLCMLAMAGTGWTAEAVIYVDTAATGAGDGSSWTDAHIYLQDALAVASGADKPVEIRVAQGIYKPDQGTGLTPGDRLATFQLLNGVTLKGGYAGMVGVDPDIRDTVLYETVLRGSFGEGSSGHTIGGDCVVTGSLTDSTAVIDGFTITNGWHGITVNEGSPTLRGILFKENHYGLYVGDGSPSLTDCTFVGNDSGIYAWDCNSVLTNCLFERNELGASFVWGNPVLEDCVFRHQDRKAIECDGSLNLLRCLFSGNNGIVSGVVDCRGALRARRCAFRTNQATAVCSIGDAELTDCEFVENSAGFGPAALKAAYYTLKATRCLFVGNSSRGSSAAVDNTTIFAQLSQCVFVGNSGSVALENSGQTVLASNCTFADNRVNRNLIEYRATTGSSVEFRNCIIWNGTDPFAAAPRWNPLEVQVSYSNVQGGYDGVGNINIDPEFVQVGHWADPDDRTTEVGPDDPQGVWVMGDYHLKSQAGHWDQGIEDWVYDDLTSPCIDAGDPNGSLGDELFPNGGYVNMGAYGGTTQASRTYFDGPVCQTHLAGDINGDCVVDQMDLDILLSHWLADSFQQVNLPPAIAIVSPEAGVEISYPDPIALRLEVSDPDGVVLYVEIDLTHRLDNGKFGAGTRISGPTDNWECEYDWDDIPYDGLYTIRAEAVDNEGARTAAAEITVTLHPRN